MKNSKVNCIAFLPYPFSKYAASLDGKVFSTYVKPGEPMRELKSRIGSTGYVEYVLINLETKKQHTIGLHRIMLLAFQPEGMTGDKKVACHRDSNKLNNKLSNLYWGSPRDNAIDFFEHEGSKSVKKKVNKEDVLNIRKLYDSGEDLIVIANMYGISKPAVCLIGQGKRWGWIQEEV